MKTNPINTFNFTKRPNLNANSNSNLQQSQKHEPSFAGYDIRPLEQMLTDAFARGAIKSRDLMLMRESISSFKAFQDGLSQLNPTKIENELYKKYKIRAQFFGDKVVAGCTALTANIFHKLRLVQPPAVTVKRLQNDNWYACCNWADRSVDINRFYDWNNVQLYGIEERINGSKSTGHFLETFLHEFMHNVHFNNIYKLAGDPRYKDNEAVQQMASSAMSSGRAVTLKLQQGSKPFKEGSVQNFVQENVSGYAGKQPSEMFAEKGAQMIADVLDMKTLRPRNNPFAFMQFTENKFLAQMMDDIWNGKFEKYVN